MSADPASKTGRLWVRLILGHRATRDAIVPCVGSDPLPALRKAMHELDLGMPVWLPRHQKDWDSFRLTRFTQEHFVETVAFDRMDISYIPSEEERRTPPAGPAGF